MSAAHFRVMPQPERYAEVILGNEEGRLIFLSTLDALKKGKPEVPANLPG